MNNKSAIFLFAAFGLCLSAGLTAKEEGRQYRTYKPSGKIYHKGWIDLNKNGRKDIYEDPSQPIEKRIEDLLSQMNVEEKTCQMVTLYGYGRILKDDLPGPHWKEALWKDGIGAIDEHLNGFRNWRLAPSDNEYVWPASRHGWAMNEVQRFFIEETRLGIPADFTNEGIRGIESLKSTDFPTQLGLGHTWDRDLIRKIGEITGIEARALGYTNVYSPILDVARDQRWGRFEESYGESPYLVAELGIQMTRGLQEDGGVASTAKHFLAYSANKGAREGLARTDPQISPRELEMVHAYPFARVIREAGLMGIMCCYNDYDGIPVEGSHYWLTERLRNDMGFDGYVVSDSDAVEYLHSKHHVSSDMKESVRQSVEAGLNVRCTFRSPDSYVLPLRELVNEGTISMETLDSRVRDILRVKFRLGLFDEPYIRNLEDSGEPSLMQALRNYCSSGRSGRNAAGASAFLEIIDSARSAAVESGISDLMNFLLEKSGLKKLYREDQDEDRLENIDELVKSMRFYEESHYGLAISLSDYLQDIALYSNADYRKESDTVKMMTIHQAKGLEFPHVFITGLSEGIFPSMRTIREYKKNGEEEERRLMYVAVTRAEKGLYLTESEGYNQSTRMNKYPSRFLAEIKRTLLVSEGHAIPETLWNGTKNLIHVLDEENYGIARDFVSEKPETAEADGFAGERDEYASPFRIGDIVSHKIFGYGEILSASKDWSSFNVRFRDGSERQIRAFFLKPGNDLPE